MKKITEKTNKQLAMNKKQKERFDNLSKEEQKKVFATIKKNEKKTG